MGVLFLAKLSKMIRIKIHTTTTAPPLINLCLCGSRAAHAPERHRRRNRHMIAALVSSAVALDNGAARTPSMGWSTWNKLKCKFDQDVLLQVADAMVSSGMAEAGYKSLNIDDCWPTHTRNSSGFIIPDPAKFPNGMGAFAKNLSQRKVELGIYTAHGKNTCQNYPGSLGFEKQDAASYAEWGVVYVKNDWCWHNEPNMSKHHSAFAAMRDALNSTGVHMVHSIHWNYKDTPAPGCARGEDCPLPELSNMWRIGGDIGPNFASVLRLIDTDAGHASAAAPGAWNDADMLEVGNGMTADQDKAHFSMWCVLASPLIAGNDVRTMSEETRKILTNKWAIGVNQDRLGKQAVLMPSKAQLFQRDQQSAPSAAVVAPCDNSSKSQHWSLAADGHLKQDGSGHCLDVFDCESGEHVAVNTYPCRNNSNKCGMHLNQKFKFHPSGSDSTAASAVGTITNDGTGACLGIAGASKHVLAQPCTNGKTSDLSLTWRFPAEPHEPFAIVHDVTGMCLSGSVSPPPTPTLAPTPAHATAQVWIKPLATPEGAFAVVLLNRGVGVANISFSFADMPFDDTHHSTPSYLVSDLWKDGASLGVKSGGVSVAINGTAAAFYKLAPSK